MVNESKLPKPWHTVLCQRTPDDPKKRPDQRTIRRYYKYWRELRNIPFQCDNPHCPFHTQELRWVDKPLNLILDHIDGNPFNNYPTNLRFLCPNCDSQLETRGGRNIGRVNHRGSGFVEVKDIAGSKTIQLVRETEDESTITLIASVRENPEPV